MSRRWRSPSPITARDSGSAPNGPPGRRRRGSRQGSGGYGPLPPGLQRKTVVGQPGDRWEREADAASARIQRGERADPVSPVTASALQAEAVTEEEPAQTAVTEEEPAQASEDEVEDWPGQNEEEPVQADQAPMIGVSQEEIVEGGGVQRQSTDEEPVQGKDGGRTVSVPSAGAGAPLPASTRQPIERGLGADLGHVRVHDDLMSRSSADGLGAKAYTRGSDIYLGSGRSASDLGLMAHESTHVVQQAGGSGAVQRLQRSVAQSDEADIAPTAPPGSTVDGQPASTRAADGTASVFESPSHGRLDTATSPTTIRLAKVGLPGWKLSNEAVGMSSNPKANPIPKRRGKTKQVSKWNSEVRPSMNESLLAKFRAAPSIAPVADEATTETEPANMGSRQIYFLRYPGTAGRYLIGTSRQLVSRALRPDWNRQGELHFYDVDHFQEIQIGGDDDLTNFWLLDAHANQSVGGEINRELVGELDDLLTTARPWVGSMLPSNGEDARATTDVTISEFQTNGSIGRQGDHTEYWLLRDVRAGVPLDSLEFMSEQEAAEANLIGDNLRLHTLFTSVRGGSSVRYAVGPDGIGGLDPEGPQTLWPHFEHQDFSYGGSTGTLIANVAIAPNLDGGDGGGGSGLLIELPVKKIRNLPQASYVNGRNIESKLRGLTFSNMSPVEWTYAEMRDGVGLYAAGVLRPSLPIFEGTEINVELAGNRVTFSKTFYGDDFTMPGPIEVTGSSLTVWAGTEGIGIDGSASFEIDRVGTGTIRASASANTEQQSFAVEGDFSFDTELFTRAEIRAWYRERQFGAEGEIEIGPGKVAGVNRATLQARWENEQLTASGEVEVDVPGVDRGTMQLTYSEADGIAIGGELQLGSDVPGIESGTLDASVTKSPDGPWVMSGGLTAVPSIPGISSQLTGRYDDGVITLRATGQYQRGMAAGSVTVGVTNQAVDEEGSPTGEITPEMRTFGGGSVTLTLAPWLQATAGIQLLPTGEIEVSGEIGLPNALEIFPERRLERELFSINLDIPIIGVAAAGQRVGIFATIGGGADLHATFGPAQLRNVRAGVVWNPDRQDETTVDGHAELHLPAGAGVRVNVNAGIGAGIPLVSATLGLEIGAELGVEASIGADFDLHWTPTTGLALQTIARASAQPKFVVDLTGFALVELDLFLATITLYEERWRLADFEFGSDLRLGITLPISYEEGEPFEPSLDDVEFDVPTINPGEFLRSVVGEII